MGWRDAPLAESAPQRGQPTSQARWMSAPVLVTAAQTTGMDDGKDVREQPPWSTAWRKSQGPTLSETERQDAHERGALGTVALGGRAVGEGVLGAALNAAQAFNPIGGVADAVLERSTGRNQLQLEISEFNRRFGTRVPEARSLPDLLSQLLSRAGAPEPTEDERVGYEALKGASGALAMGGAGGLAPNAAALLTRTGAAAAGSVAASGALGGAAPEIVRQEGGGPVEQTLAGVTASLLPSGTRAGVSELLRRGVRGGEAGRQRVGDNIATFEQSSAGVPTMGQATQNRRMQAAESLLSRVPGGAGVMAQRAERQAENLGGGVERLASRLVPKSSAEQAGRTISRGISDAGGFFDRFKSKSAQLYDEVDRYIPADQRVSVDRTKYALSQLAAPVRGAEATSKHLINSRIGAIAENLMLDAKNGTLPYEAVKRLRTLVGEELMDAPLKGDVPISQWRRLYGALAADMEIAANGAGPQAARAYKRADNHYRSGSRRMEVLEPVLNRNGGPEAIFRAATSGTKEGASTLRATMQSLPADAQRMISATVLRRLGRAKPGHQDDLGEAFSAESFLTNWNAMSREAKSALFDRYGPDFRQSLDQIAKVTANLRQGAGVFRNPSGTAQALTQKDAALAALLAVFTGHPGTAAGIGAGVGTANLAARLLTNPTAVRWLAVRSQAPRAALPALVNPLLRSDDADLRQLGELVQHQVRDNADEREERGRT